MRNNYLKKQAFERKYFSKKSANKTSTKKFLKNNTGLDCWLNEFYSTQIFEKIKFANVKFIEKIFDKKKTTKTVWKNYPTIKMFAKHKIFQQDSL